jgi:hypothetical protein
MRYKAQGFPKGGALYLIAEKKRHRKILHHETNYPPEDWKIGRLEDWKIGRLEDWKILLGG